MKETLINFKNKSSDRPIIYSTKHLNGNFNPIQQEKYSFVNISNNDNIYKLEITNENIEGINNIHLDIYLPEIKGYGLVYYNKYFAYSLIKSFKLSIKQKKSLNEEIYNSFNIIDCNGLKLLENFLLQNNTYQDFYNTKMLNISSWLEKREGFGNDYIIYEKQKITIPIITFFDTQEPFNIFRLPKSSILIFELCLNDISKVINYNKEFKELSLNKIKLNYSPFLTITEYNTCDEIIYDRNIEQPEICINIGNDLLYQTPQFKNISKITYTNKSKMFCSSKSFIAYPDFDANEQEYIKLYEETILNQIIQILDKPDFSLYPSNSIFEEVPPDGIIKFNKNNSCYIDIIGIPTNKKIYYHKNILTFNRRNNEKIKNISEEFRYITGIYFAKTNIIKFDKIKSNITIYDVSIPNEFWSNEINTTYGDLRNVNKKNKTDIYVNNDFIYGLDFLGKNNGFDSVIIKAGTNIIIENNFIDYKTSILLNKHNYITTEGISFNNNDINYIEPSRLIAKPNENFNRCSLQIKFKNIDETSIYNLFDFDTIITIYHLKKILYNTNTGLFSIVDI